MGHPEPYAVEVLVRWGASTLHVSHASPPRGFSIGEEPGCDCFVPRELLGDASRADLVVVRGTSIAIVMLPGATGTIDVPGQGRIEFHDLVAAGAGHPFREASAEHVVELPPGARARIEVGGLVLEIAAVPAAERPRRAVLSRHDRGAAMVLALCFLLHVGVVGALAFAMPSSSREGSGGVDRGQFILTQKLLVLRADEEPLDDEDDSCRHHEPGTRGTPASRETKVRYGVMGPQDNPDPHLQRHLPVREALYEEAPIGVLDPAAGDTRAFTVAWGRDDSLGNDALSGRGRLWGTEIGDAFGYAAVDVSHRHVEKPPPKAVVEEEPRAEEPAPDASITLRSVRTIGSGTGIIPDDFDRGHGRLARMKTR